MKKWVIAMAGCVAMAATGSQAAPRLAPVLGEATYGEVVPVPDQPGGAVPMPGAAAPMPSGTVVIGTPITLYGNVKYKDRRNIAPCAVPMIVEVPDPCNPCCCVAVQICVPPCGTPCITTSKCGTKVKYDYGKYAVEIATRKNRVVVDYDD